jgi:pSer/pThr/pTyr-binding forkhead associated (FHA) protein
MVTLRDSSGTNPGPPTISVNSSVPLERSRASRLDGSLAPQTVSLTLPQNQTIKISVVSGPSCGIDCELSRPLVTIGRLGGGADVEIDDPEVSRVHCALEVRDGAIFLHDLSSTNGTYIGDSRILASRLEHMSKFRIGSTLLQVSVHSV